MTICDNRRVTICKIERCGKSWFVTGVKDWALGLMELYPLCFIACFVFIYCCLSLDSFPRSSMPQIITQQLEWSDENIDLPGESVSQGTTSQLPFLWSQNWMRNSLESDSDTYGLYTRHMKGIIIFAVCLLYRRNTCLAHIMLHHRGSSTRCEQNQSQTPECLSLSSHEGSGCKNTLTFICLLHVALCFVAQY